MHLAFIDIVYGYGADRPNEDAPLGGTTSAVCFLAQELVKAGIQCTLFNKITAPQEAHGVKALPLTHLAQAITDPSYTAFIFCGRWMEGMVKLVREKTKAPLIAWAHESRFAPPLTPALAAFDGVVFVSEWQQHVTQADVLPNWRKTVIRNAMNPKAAGMFENDGAFLRAKAKPPILLYAGSFARGAFTLPDILDKMRPHRKDFTLEIFANTDPSRNSEQDEKYIGWLRGLPNISHVGMVGQSELIGRMTRASVMLVPNPWPETSCIAMIEAMATGLAVIATNRAALPETAAGFETQIAIENPDDPLRFDMPVPAINFAGAALKALDEFTTRPESFAQKRRAQMDYFNTYYQWSQRVKPWAEFVNSLIG